jgi:hypothetical protein
LHLDPQDAGSLYAATGEGLFYSPNQGKSWKRIFKGQDCLQRQGTALAVLDNAIYLGTKAGLFTSQDKGRSWHKEKGILGNSHILTIATNAKAPDGIFVACVSGLFKSSGQSKSWEKILVTHPVENGSENDEQPEDQDEEERFSRVRYLSLDPNNSNILYLATSLGIYKSEDRGRSWETVSDYGLLSRDVKLLLVSSKSKVYAATKNAVFEYAPTRWQELSFGLVAEDIRFLTLDNKTNLYVACDKGLFKLRPANSVSPQDYDIICAYFKDEPRISDVQQAAIKYAEVEPEKIQRWRKQASKKAWLPQFSADIGRNVTDLWHWETGSSTKADDDVLRRGNDAIEWDVTLSWDLSEIIWNNDQTSIDARSRLMVQLRDDILDEVTKLYFERIRVKSELDNLSLEDRKKRFERELKLQELAASLDALTGGYFSRQIEAGRDKALGS